MASASIRTRTTKSGERRYRVEFRLGGRASRPRYGGSLPRKADADERKRWILGELAARRVPDVGALEAVVDSVPTFEAAARQWLGSRLDVAESTKTNHRVNVSRAIAIIGKLPIDRITPQRIAEMVAELHAAGVKRSYLRKILQATAMVFDHAEVVPNPARASGS